MSETTVNANALVMQVVELTRERWRDVPQQAGVTIELQADLAEALPAVQAVEADLREALTQLIFNAADAMVDGGRLTISTQAIQGQGGAPAVRICVADTGVGMDDETRRRCLQPDLATLDGSAPGLRLALVNHTVQRHGGQLAIDSAPGRGTRVDLSLPAAAAAAPASQWSGLSVPGRPSRPLRVLLVDDDPLLLRSVGEALVDAGHWVQPEPGGQAGIDAFLAAVGTEARFDVVITDLGMPEVDGRQVALAVKAASPATPVVMLTGWGRRMIEDGESPPGVDHVMSKPPRMAAIEQVLALCTGAG